jgi:hypothetical protein
VAVGSRFSTENPNVGASSDLILHKHVPIKVSIFAWRLMCDKLPTKDNPAAREIISQDMQLCANGCGDVELVSHLFFSWRLMRVRLSTKDNLAAHGM